MAHTSVWPRPLPIWNAIHLFFLSQMGDLRSLSHVYSLRMRRSVAVSRTQWRIFSRFSSFLSLSNYRITFWDLNWEGTARANALSIVVGRFTIAVHPPTHVILSRKRWFGRTRLLCTFQHIAIARVCAATAVAHIWMKPIRKWRGRFAEIRFASMIFKRLH